MIEPENRLSVDYFFEDTFLPWDIQDTLTDRPLCEKDYLNKPIEARKMAIKTFEVMYRESVLQDLHNSDLMSYVCELDKSIWMKRGYGFTLEELSPLYSKSTRQDWVLNAIQCVDFQKELVLAIHNLP